MIYRKQWYIDNRELCLKRQKQHRSSLDVKEKRRKYGKQYRSRLDVKERTNQWLKHYRQSKTGIATRKRTEANKRNMKYIPLMTNPFPEEISVDYHHVLTNYHAIDADNSWNKLFVIPIPKVTHRFVGGGAVDLGHWRHNEKWIQKLYDFDINLFLKGRLVQSDENIISS